MLTILHAKKLPYRNSGGKGPQLKVKSSKKNNFDELFCSICLGNILDKNTFSFLITRESFAELEIARVVDGFS